MVFFYLRSDPFFLLGVPATKVRKCFSRLRFCEYIAKNHEGLARIPHPHPPPRSCYKVKPNNKSLPNILNGPLYLEGYG